MKYEQYFGDGVSYAFRINFLDDVLDLKRFKTKRFKNFKEITGLTQEIPAKRLCKQIFNDFLMLVGKDMIDENEIYTFPMREFGYMKISLAEDVVFNIETDGVSPKPVMRLDRRLIKRNKVHYGLQFGKELKTRFEAKVASGHKYV